GSCSQPADGVSDISDQGGELRSPGWRFPAPERDRRRRAMRVLDEDTPRNADPTNPPRRVAEQEDVAGHAFDREIFVDGADDRPFGFSDDRVQRRVSNGAAAGDGDQPA